VSNARRYRGRPLSVGRAPALRVLHVAQPSDGGSLVCAAHLVVDQIARGWTVGVATQSNLLSRTAEDHGANYFAWTALRRPGFSVLEESHRLSRIVACFAPDVLHLHAAKAGLCGRLAVRGRRATLYQPHGWSFYAADGLLKHAALKWERFATRWSASTICVSEDERRSGQAAGIRGRWTVIPNGVDTGRWRPPSSAERAQARRDLGVPQDATLAVTVARLHRAKGVDVLLRAWSELHRHAPSARLIVVGVGPEMAKLMRARPGGVTLAGATDPRQCLAAADVFVAPSRWEAGASLAVMEAMAQGLPVVATQVDGMAAILERRYLAPVDDPRALARILEELLGDEHQRHVTGARNRDRVHAERNLEACLECTADLTLQVERRHSTGDRRFRTGFKSGGAFRGLERDF
jgi:glycosyltransferase involved in cell wall biosynthesis